MSTIVKNQYVTQFITLKPFTQHSHFSLEINLKVNKMELYLN